jgi:hypothetical protein
VLAGRSDVNSYQHAFAAVLTCTGSVYLVSLLMTTLLRRAPGVASQASTLGSKKHTR